MDSNIKNNSLKKLENLSAIQEQRLEEAFLSVIESSKLISSRTQMRISLDIYNKTKDIKAKEKIKKIISDALTASNKLLGISILDLKKKN